MLQIGTVTIFIIIFRGSRRKITDEHHGIQNIPDLQSNVTNWLLTDLVLNQAGPVPKEQQQDISTIATPAT